MNAPQTSTITARALLLSDRIDTARLEQSDLLATNPLTFTVGTSGGKAVVFRYGVVVLIGTSAAEQESVLANVRRHITGGFHRREEETATIELGGPIYLRALTPERAILIAEALAKSVVLARDENEVAGVFDLIEPLARQ